MKYVRYLQGNFEEQNILMRYCYKHDYTMSRSSCKAQCQISAKCLKHESDYNPFNFYNVVRKGVLKCSECQVQVNHVVTREIAEARLKWFNSI